MGPRLPPQAIVIFGATGDLTRRKLLPAFFHLYVEGLLPKGFAIIGFGRTDWSDDALREHALRSLSEFARCDPQTKDWDGFASHLRYFRGEFAEKGSLDPLVGFLEEIDSEFGTQERRFFYCATPPDVYEPIVARLGETGLAKDAKIVFEKPFGHDLASAHYLNECIHSVFDEDQVFRIDHYMGKETVQNILAFRFTNGLFEPVWNRRYIDHVQITVAEEIGIEGRGHFYEQTGALRDMVQTHLLQVLTFVAMEPPTAFAPDPLQDEKVKVLRAIHPVDPDRVVRGQYVGYHDEVDVARRSTVETFVALELRIENWRWAGVPFFLRTGKELAKKTTQVTLVFKDVPFNVFRDVALGRPRRDHLTIRIQPDEGITLAVNVKEPGPDISLGRATLDFDYETEFPSELLDAYELLMIEAMEGDHTLFLRQDNVERAWEILMPALEHPAPLLRYEPGTWGPEEASILIEPHRWHSHARRT
jgi:glucose-6-phosphate 1-dehydrogenase